MKKNSLFSPKSSKGFTLPELLASIAIMGIIMTVVIYNHRQFDSQLELTNVAYRVAISIREAQTYGVSVKEFNDSSTRRFDVPYGISFYATNFNEPSYVFFGDSNPNLTDHSLVYDGPVVTGCAGGASDECIERINLGAGNTIKKVCAYSSTPLSGGEGAACIPSGGNTSGLYQGINSLNVVFKRPKSDAIITASKVMNGSNIPVTGATQPLSDMFICLQSPQGKNKAVHVSSAGQISVEDVVFTGNLEINSSVCFFQ